MFYSQECDSGKYGPGCILTCGACINNTPCHHFNGSCLQGCGPGYKEQKCDNGALISLSHFNCFTMIIKYIFAGNPGVKPNLK